MKATIASEVKRTADSTLARLASTARMIDECAAKARDLQAKQEAAYAGIEAEFEAELADIRAKLAVVQSFIKIARANASVLEECPHAIPFDRAGLARIQVLINVHSK